ncbi:MAG: hypothetical protein EOP11_27385, partial [Proteobacteria bacterium]
DLRNVKNGSGGAPDQYVEQIRQKLGTDFSDSKATGKKRNELGKDDFIKLMAAQMKHQDPFSPVKNEEMAAQLAQFSSLEQMTNVNQNLEKMASAQKPTENVLSASLIGKRVTMDSSRFLQAKGQQPELKFEMPSDGENVTVTVVDAKGEVVRDYELGTMAKGPQSIRWDGKNSKNLDATPGEFTYRVNANDGKGTPLTIDNTTAGLVEGIVFESGKAQLLVDGKKIPMEAVGRIELDKPAPAPAAPTVSRSPALAPPQAGYKQDLATSTNPGEEAKKLSAPQKNSLPPELDAEKINSMLSALGGASRMDAETETGVMEPDAGSLPLWNPANL